MKKLSRRVLGLLLCVLMLTSLLPVAAFAEEMASAQSVPAPEEAVTDEVTLTEEKQSDTYLADGTDDLTPDEYGDYHISSFAELKVLSEKTYETSTAIFYEHEEDFVFTENLTLPENIQFLTWSDIRIPSGVKVTVLGDLNSWGKTLYVEGELTIYGFIDLQNINVSGSLTSYSFINIASDGEVTGEENISFIASDTYSTSGFFINYYVDSYEGFKAAVQEINTNKPNRSYSLDCSGESTITIKDQLSLGENVDLYVNCPLVIAESGKLSVRGQMSISRAVTVNGSLVNDGTIDIYHSNDPTASITLGETGIYSGTGTIDIYTETLASPEEALPGFDLTDYEADSNGMGWTIRSVAGLEKLATPVDLLYGFEYDYIYDENWDITGYETVAAPGVFSWRVDGTSQNQFKIEIYKDGGQTPVSATSWHFGSAYTEERIYSVDDFVLMDPESGEYYFTVRSVGDHTQYSNSDTAVSDTWTYVKPELSLDACSRPVVDGQDVSFLLPEELVYVGGWEAEIYYSAEPDMADNYCTGGTWQLNNQSPSQREAESYIYDDAIQTNGSGYYAVRVRALSRDIESACNGPWSELSEPCYIGDTVEEVDSILQDIEDGTVEPTSENVREQVQQIDTEDLKKAMLADGDDSGVNSSLQALEAYTGGTEVQVTDGMAGRFSQEQVSVIGASLNNVQNGEEPVKLIVDQAKENDVIPEAFDNTVAVRFSLELENVDSTQLDVPVKITLPVPDGVNPEFLVILHYHVTGEEPEEIWPYVFQQDGQYYASFVLTSFSDFVMTVPVDQGTECRHVWDEGKVTAEPGSETTGIRIYTCKLCGETRTEVIPALKVDGELSLSTTLSKNLSLMRVELKNLGVYVDGVKIAVWSTKLGKSTLKEFAAENKDGVWTVNVPLCAFDLCTADVFQVEAYGVKAAKSELLAQTKVDIVAAPTHVYTDEADDTCNSCGRVRKTDLSGVKTTPMYRLYNPFTGEHFYTGSAEERDNLSAIGWKYEGVAWNSPVSGGIPVHRVYNPNSGDHHYTTDMAEVLMLLNAGWQYENICWNSAFSNAVPQYRMWNRNADLGSHHYTSSTEERKILVDAGWIYEGIGWYGMKN